MTPARRRWTRAEQLTVLRYYLQTPFGRLHSGNSEIRTIAERLDRTPDSIAMKGSNYASLDPKITGTGRRGLAQTSALDREVWELMRDSFEVFEQESAAAATSFGLDPVGLTLLRSQKADPSDIDPGHETEDEVTVTVRRKQDYFRRTVLAAYRNTCPITGIAIPELLTASHIVPWNASTRHRLNPSNGIALNALHDRAFDRGLISFANDLTILVSSKLQSNGITEMSKSLLLDIKGLKANPPDRFQPDLHALAYHRDIVFVS